MQNNNRKNNMQSSSVIKFKTSSYIVPFEEMAAYEALWKRANYSFKKIAELFINSPNSLPSDLMSSDDIIQTKNELRQLLYKSVIKTNVLINNTYDYPEKLRDAKEPVEIIYYSGNLELLKTRTISVVGSRKPTEEGERRTKKLVKLLVGQGFTIVSGLAEGIDTIAHKTTIDNSGRTIAVIGTPLDEFYPKNNKTLQLQIAKDHLLISQVPFLKYKSQDYRWNRGFFPERNKTMSALTDATIIVEASETSGTLIQAKAAIDQGRKLFILQNCFENKKITWPEKFEKMGAIRVKDFSDILSCF